MGKTPILQLETNNSTTDASQKFLTYRMNQNGDINSNMTKIDGWADTVNKKVKELQDRVSTVLLNANWVSLGYYEATTLEITELKANMLFTIRLNKDNDGTTTIKVNGLTTKNLLKYDSSGALVNLVSGDLKKNKEYQFRYDGTSFVWQSGVSGDQVNVSGVSGDIIAISADNIIEDSGIKAEQINTNKDTIGNKEALKTTEKSNLVGAINEVVDDVGSEVLTTVSQTVKGAINEVDSKAAKDIAYDPLGTELVATNVGDAINEVEGKRLILSEDIGNKSNLQTDDKTNLVSAINEVKSQSNHIVTDLANKAIVESGSNENGRYVKFGDGTMICSRYIPNFDFSNTDTNRDYDMPVIFADTLTATSISAHLTNTKSVWDGISKTIVMAGMGVWRIGVTKSTEVQRDVILFAVGRWK